jgi:hypothetical protein
MQGPFGPQRDPHQDWMSRLEEGAYEQWKQKQNRQPGVGTRAGQVISWIVFLGFILLVIVLITSAQ